MFEADARAKRVEQVDSRLADCRCEVAVASGLDLSWRIYLNLADPVSKAPEAEVVIWVRTAPQDNLSGRRNRRRATTLISLAPLYLMRLCRSLCML